MTAACAGSLVDVIVQGAKGHVIATLSPLLCQSSCDAFRGPEVRPEEHS
jgi:hypothetical protein